MTVNLRGEEETLDADKISWLAFCILRFGGRMTVILGGTSPYDDLDDKDT